LNNEEVIKFGTESAEVRDIVRLDKDLRSGQKCVRCLSVKPRSHRRNSSTQLNSSQLS